MFYREKALIVGGSNGIGLAIADQMIKKEKEVVIMDICPPAQQMEGCTYIHCNLLDFKEELFIDLINDQSIKYLVITAGFGRIADFENIHIAEIEKLINLNTTATLKIVSLFYNRIKSENPFYTCIMGSIAGLVSSPMFSVYAASKAALCRFSESVNIEIESAGVDNRILNVSPGSIKGTKFNGGENDLTQTMSLANDIVEKMLKRESLFIPNYDVYSNVIKRYQEDAHKFGLESYEYKKQSGRVKNDKITKIGYLSGTFDLFHIGHLNLLKRAKEQCDYLIVGVHKDASHKGKETFIPFEERMEIVKNIKYVDKAVASCTEDSDAWELHHFDKLFVGSDYKGTERFLRYEKFFEDKGVEIVYFPYTQGTSSTQIRNLIDKKQKNKEESQ